MVEKGFLSPYFINQPEKREVVFENPYVFITDKKINLVQQELIRVIEPLKGRDRPLLMIADDIAQDVLATLILNNLRGTLRVAAIRSPGFGAIRKAMLQDIAILTGATLLNEDAGITFKNFDLSFYGEAQKVTITEKTTSIISLNKQKNQYASDAVEQHCLLLRKQINLTDNVYEKQQYQDRIAKLTGGVAVIKVGAITETEMKEKKLRLEDAINATKAAIDEGVVPGGGAVFIHLSEFLRNWAKSNLAGDELIGAYIIADAITYPLMRIAKNAGQNGYIIIEDLLKQPMNIGYDAMNENLSDMYENGIIDPAKVTRSSLQNAASIASMVLTTECVIVESNE
jgi:chaperonin GroEL